MATNNIPVTDRLYWMDRLLSDPRYNQQDLLRKKVSFQWYLASFAGAIILTAFAFVIGAGVLGHYGLWLCGTYLIGFSAYLAFHYNRYNLFFLFVIILITTVFIARCGGIAHSGGLIFAGLSCAFSTILMNSIYRSMMVFGWYAISVLVLGISGPYFPVHPDMTPGINNLFFTINTIWLSASQLLFVIGYLREKGEIEEREVQRLQDLNEAKSRLYTNVTHEFRTPLTIILGMAEQLRRSETTVLEAARLIRYSGRRLLQLVNQLLSLARLDSGQEPLHWTCTNAVGFLRYLVSSFQSTADQRQVSLALQTSVDEVCLDLDLEKWESIFGNLLTNALKFTPAGGRVTVRVSLAGKEVLQVEVADTGQGIPADHLPHIFERFYQVERHWEHHQEGSGIGLALVREYTELLGGTVHVASTPKEGTAFRLRFPIHREAPEGPTHYHYQPAEMMGHDPLRHLDDETFSIAELCRELAMSRTQLYRKFAALTNMTVNQYLRRYRLYEARRLLLDTDLSVSQVALEVGLPNPSYFSRVFTETFGINPSQVHKTPPA